MNLMPSRQISAAVLALMTTLTSQSSAKAEDWFIGNEAVINVKVQSDTDPIPTSFSLALAQSKKLQKAYPNASKWLVNIGWPSALTGVQFILKGNTASFQGASPEGWIRRFSFNGGSEQGIIEAARWCRRGAINDYANICGDVEKHVDSRRVRHLIFQ